MNRNHWRHQLVNTITSVHGHCVLIFQVFLSTLAPTLPPKKSLSCYKTFLFDFFFKFTEKDDF